MHSTRQPWRGPCLLFMVLLLSACASGPIAPAAGTTPTTPGRVAAERDAYREPGDALVRRSEDLPLALPEIGSREPWTFAVSATTGYILGGSGGLDAFTNAVSASLTHRFHIASTLTFALAYNRRDYDFEAGRGLLAGLDEAPGQLHSIGGTISLFQPLSREWAVFLSAGVAGSTEVGVDPFEDPSFVGIVVVGHQVTPKLQLGAGVLVAARPGEDPFWFPIPQVDWTISDRWRFATEDAGGGFIYKLSDTVDVAGLVVFDTRRYRLDEKGPGTPGIFEDSRTSLVLRSQWKPSEDVSAAFHAGLDVIRYLEVADEDGRVLSDESAGLGGFIRFALNIAF